MRVAVAGRAVDIVGTGGDRANTVNISTMAAVVAAGGRGAGGQARQPGRDSACGAADVLEGSGVAIDLPAAAVAAGVAEVGIGFCFAPVYHPSMRHAAAPRRELGIPTAFNFLGPLTNPAQPATRAGRLRRSAAGAGDGGGVRRAGRVECCCSAATTGWTS